MRKFLPVFIFFIMIGMIALGLNTIFGYNTITYLERVNINNVWIYKYDIWSYIEEIRNQLQNTAKLELAWQTRQWMNFDANIFDGEFWEGLINNLAYLLNVIIFGLNVMLYPVRIGGYALAIIGTFLGLPFYSALHPEINPQYQNNPLNWLYYTIDFIITLQIPYV